MFSGSNWTIWWPEFEEKKLRLQRSGHIFHEYDGILDFFIYNYDKNTRTNHQKETVRSFNTWAKLINS